MIGSEIFVATTINEKIQARVVVGYTRYDLSIIHFHRLKPISQLRFDYDTTTIRRYHDAFDYDGSDRNYDLRSIRLRYDYDEKTDMFIFCSRRIASNGSRRAR